MKIHMKNKLHLFTITALAAAAFATSLNAADSTPAPARPDNGPDKPVEAATPAAATSASKETKAMSLPFKGKIASADKDKKTITLTSKKGESRTFVIGDSTTLSKGDTDATATWDDLKVGESVRGSYTKSSDGTLEVKMLKVGAKTAGAGKTKKKKASADSQ